MATGIPLGPYRLVKRLAVGGMAEIFLARREGPQGFTRELVVKRILPHLAEDEEFIEMFLAEARFAARLHHPNVVHVYDFGQAAESYYLAMELVRGVDLRALIARARMLSEKSRTNLAIPPHHTAKIASFVCEGLAHAHALALDNGMKGLVHRDVTPSNVLISFDGAVRLADFGIAKAQEGIERREPTGHGVVKGKYAYLSPEQARGERLDARSDLFNVGILLFECATGESLFPPDDSRQAKRLAATGTVPGLDRLQVLPQPLATIIRKALAPDPGSRYPDALSLRSDLEAFLRGRPEHSGAVELGLYVRALFPDVLNDDRPRAAGTVPHTVAVTARLPDPNQPPKLPSGEISTELPTYPRKPANRRRWMVGALVATLLATLASAVALWPNNAPPLPTDGPPREPPITLIAPSVALAEVRIGSQPQGANVSIDGVARGITPLIVTLDPTRPHRIEARTSDDAIRSHEEVSLAPGEIREVMFRAGDSERARLRVISTPPGARVEVDGDPVGVTPFEAWVATGRRQVRVHREGFADVVDHVDLTGPEQTATLSFALQRSRPAATGGRTDRRPESVGEGSLSIATTPWSEVYFRGRHLGTTPLANVRMPAGQHELTLRHPGREDRRVSVSISATETTRVRLAL